MAFLIFFQLAQNGTSSQEMKIKINGNSEFNDLVMEKEWLGEGTINKPFIIKDLNLSTSSGNPIDIRNTNVYFKISNCMVKGGENGIFLSNVSNALITSNEISSNGYDGLHLKKASNCTIRDNFIPDAKNVGIYLENSPSIMIQGNTVLNTGKDGISLHTSSTNCLIEKNNVTNSGHYGIYAERSKECNITQNHVFRSGYASIEISSSGYGIITNNSVIRHQNSHSIATSDSPSSLVSHNYVLGNNLPGITIHYSPDSLVHNNVVKDDNIGIYVNFSPNTTIFDCFFENNSYGIVFDKLSDNSSVYSNNITNSRNTGIAFEETDNSIIRNNVIIESVYSGLWISNLSKNNTFILNDFINNNIGGASQGYDSGSANNITGNYWNDWTSPDANLDGIVDNPYLLDGDTGNQDSQPRTHPIQTSSMIVEFEKRGLFCSYSQLCHNKE